MMGERQFKVLISSYACEPEKGSEPGTGWNYVLNISRFHKVWVITRSNNRKPIDNALEHLNLENVKWVYFDLPYLMRFWKKGAVGIGIYYYLWQIGAYFVAKKLHKEICFDLTHHLTFARFWAPSFISLLPVPFVWGPIGGADLIPKGFKRIFSFRNKLRECLRSAAVWLAIHDPFFRLTARKAKMILATTAATKEKFVSLGFKNVELFPHLGLTEEEVELLSAYPVRTSLPFRFISIGRLVAEKGMVLGLEAFAIFEKNIPESEYWIVGSGSERRHLEGLVNRLGLQKKVRFFGGLKRSETLEKMAECDVLLYTCLRDSGVWVILEAMAEGKPIISLGLGGAALQIDSDAGLRVQATAPDQAINDMASAMYKLASNVELRASMGASGRIIVKERHLWTQKAAFIDSVYNNIVSHQGHNR